MNIKRLQNISLKSKSWIRRGGIVENYYIPANNFELIEVGQYLYGNNIDFQTIGATSNIYFRDSFNINSIVDTKQLTDYQILDDETLQCDCGTRMSILSRFCVNQGYAGYEGLINLPGTVGGAIVNNSGCYNCEVSKILKSIDMLTPEGEVVNIKRENLGYNFRSSYLKTSKIKGIVLRAYFDISHRRDVEKLQKEAAKNTNDRKATQDSPAHNLGSTVNCIRYRMNLKNLLIRIILKCSYLLMRNRFAFIRKYMILTFYNKRYLNDYISDKRLECFLWKDEDADKYFEDYMKLIDEVYREYSIEIEIK